MHYYGFDAHVSARALNAQGYFSAIGNQNFLEHDLTGLGIPLPATLADHHQGFAVLDRLTVLDHDRLDHTVLVGFDLVHQLHRLDDADGLSRFDRISNLDEWFCAGGTRSVKRANHR